MIYLGTLHMPLSLFHQHCNVLVRPHGKQTRESADIPNLLSYSLDMPNNCHQIDKVTKILEYLTWFVTCFHCAENGSEGKVIVAIVEFLESWYQMIICV